MVSFGLHVLLLQIGLATAQDLQRRDDSDNILGSFVRAAHWEATVIGDVIYIDGGQISLEEDDGDLVEVDRTLFINCTESWNPNDVAIRFTQRAEQIPHLKDACMFTTEDSFYIWGGISPGEPGNTSQLWQFEASDRDIDGYGDWKSTVVENGTVFGSIAYRESAACVSTPERAYAFGGSLVNMTEGGTEEGSQATGLVTFDFATRTFEERWEDDGYQGNHSPDGSVWGGTATFVPTFGDEGVIILLGGQTRRAQAGDADKDMMDVDVYDVAGERWYSQRATHLNSATVDPPLVVHHCAVGVADTGNGTSFEIFVYGGKGNTAGNSWSTVYALSLPGFTWTDVSDVQTDGMYRSHHACVNVNGSSLLVSLGGISFGFDNAWTDQDPYPQGIGIYDMNRLEWVDEYDADADGYATNSKIRSWYDEGNLGSVEWSSDGVRDLFIKNSTITVDSEGTGSSTPTGAIAGGVVGGLAGLAIVAGLAWWFWRRRQRRQQSSNVEAHDPPPLTEMSTATPKPSTPPALPPSEMGSNTSPVPELYTSSRGFRPVSELEGSVVRQ